MMERFEIVELDAEGAAKSVPQLAGVLLDCVEGGASVGFMWPLARSKAEAFWEGVAAAVARKETFLLVARDASGIAGTVQLKLALMENQPHRADVSKLLVHRRARRGGLGEALMRRVEELAADRGRRVLVLDTATPEAERLYARTGWQRCGEIPDYALMPDGSLCETVVYWKHLGPPRR